MLEQRLEEARGGGLPGESLDEAALRVVELATALRLHDRRTRGHCERVRVYADMIGREMALSKQEREKLHWAALLHDVGKLEVPADILNKKGKPSAEEWEILRGHPDAGRSIIAPLLDWLGPWAAAAWEHHEYWDGRGYPRGLQGGEITLSGRIVAVADAFEVMTATRSYKKPMTPGAARRELTRCAGTQFDPAVVRALLSLSIGRLNRVMGPITWVAQLPFLGWTAPTALPATLSTIGRTVVLASAIHAAAPGLVPFTPVEAASTSPVRAATVTSAQSPSRAETPPGSSTAAVPTLPQASLRMAGLKATSSSAEPVPEAHVTNSGGGTDNTSGNTSPSAAAPSAGSGGLPTPAVGPSVGPSGASATAEVAVPASPAVGKHAVPPGASAAEGAAPGQSGGSGGASASRAASATAPTGAEANGRTSTPSIAPTQAAPASQVGTAGSGLGHSSKPA